jgi:hypothetical protein
LRQCDTEFRNVKGRRAELRGNKSRTLPAVGKVPIQNVEVVPGKSCIQGKRLVLIQFEVHVWCHKVSYQYVLLLNYLDDQGFVVIAHQYIIGLVV